MPSTDVIKSVESFLDTVQLNLQQLLQQLPVDEKAKEKITKILKESISGSDKAKKLIEKKGKLFGFFSGASKKDKLIVETFLDCAIKALALADVFNRNPKIKHGLELIKNLEEMSQKKPALALTQQLQCIKELKSNLSDNSKTQEAVDETIRKAMQELPIGKIKKGSGLMDKVLKLQSDIKEFNERLQAFESQSRITISEIQAAISNSNSSQTILDAQTKLEQLKKEYNGLVERSHEFLKERNNLCVETHNALHDQTLEELDNLSQKVRFELVKKVINDNKIAQTGIISATSPVISIEDSTVLETVKQTARELAAVLQTLKQTASEKKQTGQQELVALKTLLDFTNNIVAPRADTNIAQVVKSEAEIETVEVERTNNLAAQLLALQMDIDGLISRRISKLEVNENILGEKKDQLVAGLLPKPQAPTPSLATEIPSCEVQLKSALSDAIEREEREERNKCALLLGDRSDEENRHARFNGALFTQIKNNLIDSQEFIKLKEHSDKHNGSDKGELIKIYIGAIISSNNLDQLYKAVQDEKSPAGKGMRENTALFGTYSFFHAGKSTTDTLAIRLNIKLNNLLKPHKQQAEKEAEATTSKRAQTVEVKKSSPIPISGAKANQEVPSPDNSPTTRMRVESLSAMNMGR